MSTAGSFPGVTQTAMEPAGIEDSLTTHLEDVAYSKRWPVPDTFLGSQPWIVPFIHLHLLLSPGFGRPGVWSSAMSP